MTYSEWNRGPPGEAGFGGTPSFSGCLTLPLVPCDPYPGSRESLKWENKTPMSPLRRVRGCSTVLGLWCGVVGTPLSVCVCGKEVGVGPLQNEGTTRTISGLPSKLLMTSGRFVLLLRKTDVLGSVKVYSLHFSLTVGQIKRRWKG